MKINILKSNALAQIFLSVICIFTIFALNSNSAHAVSNTTTLNFQARLLTAAGAVVPDGSYNVDFKIYNTSTPTAGTVGTCTSPCLWEETYAYGGYAGGTASIGPQVTVKNGYVSVNLGAYSTFATYALANWSQQLYLSMNIGGTTSSGVITWDGEMGNGGPLSTGHSLLALTAVPVAFTANQLSTNNTGGQQILQFASGTSAGTITLPDVAGNVVIAQSGTPTAATGNDAISGYSSANNFVAIAGSDALDTSTGGALNIGTTTATSIVLGQSTSIASTNRLSVGTTGTATSQLYVSANIPTTYLGSVATGNSPNSVYVQGNYAYSVNYGSNTLQVFDISNPASPALIATSATIGLSGPRSVYVQGRYAYVVNGTGSTLQIFDISNPHSPSSSGSVATGTNPYSVYVQGLYAYVVNSTSNTLQVIDISNPTIPTITGTSATTGLNGPESIYVQGHYAYVANNGGQTFQVFDISNPASPTSVGSVSTGANAPDSVYVQGRYAYVVNFSGNTLQVIDISNPTIPTITDTSATTGLSGPRSVYVQGRYAYVANNVGSTLQVFDISNPASPTSVGSVPAGPTPDSVYVKGRYAYVVSTYSGTLQTFDLGGSYIQQLEAGGAEVGTLTVDSNSQVNGSESISGGLSVSSGAEISGSVGISGSVNTANTLQVMNSTGVSILNVNTSSSSVNLDQLLPPGTVTTVSPPVISSLTTSGTAQTTSYTYEVVAAVTNGAITNPSSTDTITTGNAILSATNYNIITWGAVTGVTNYYVYRTASGGTPSSTGLIGVIPSGTTTLHDTGLSAAGTAPSTPGSLTNNTTYYFQVTTIDGTGGQTIPNTEASQSIGGIGPTATTSGSETGTTLTLGYASTPAWVGQAGQQVTLSGYNMNTGSVNGTWTILTASATSMTINIVGGVTSTISTPGTASLEYSGINLSWAPVTGARGYNVYYGTSSLSESNYFTTYTNSYNFSSLIYTPTSGSETGTALTLNLPSTPSTWAVGQALTLSGFLMNTGSVNGTWLISSVTGTSVVLTITNGVTSTVSTIGIVAAGAIGAGTPPTVSTAYNNTLSTTGNSQITLGNTTGSASGAQLDVAGNVPTTAVGSVKTNTNPTSVYVQGNYAYVVNSTSNTLQVIDVSVPGSPVVIGTSSTSGLNAPYSVYVQGGYAYVANGGGTLQVFNVYNPASPISVANVTTGGLPAAVYVQGTYAYLANKNSNTLQVFNVSNPTSPVIIGTSATTGLNGPDSVYVQGNYAYVANAGGANLQVFNVSNPASPTSVSSVTTGTAPYSAIVQGRYAYVVNNTSNTLQVIDISNPVSPVVVGTSATTGLNSPASVFVQGHYAYVTNSGGATMQVFDVSNPASPISIGITATSSAPNSVYVQGRYAYVVNAGSTLQIFDLGGAYIQQLQAGGAEVGALTVDTNAQVNGSESISGGLSVGSGVQVAGSVGINGSEIITGGSSAAVVQQANNAGTGTVAATFGSNTVVGHTIVLMAQVSSASNTVQSVTGAGVSSWTKISSASIDTGGYDTEMWYGNVTSSGSNALTVIETGAGTDTIRLIAAEVSGLSSSPVDQAATSTFSSSTTPTSPTITTTSNNEIVFAFAKDGGIGASITTPTNGFTALTSPVVYNALAYETTNSAGAYYTSWTASPSDTGTVGTVSFFDSSANPTSAFQVQNVSGSIALNVNTANSSVNLDQILAPGTITATLPPTISNTTTFGTAGGTTYTYEVVAAVANGSFTYSSPASANTLFGNPTLSGSNYNIVNWGTVTGATNYYVYRTVGGGTQGLIGVVAAGTTSLNDTGLTATGALPYQPVASPPLTNSQAYYFKVTAIDGTGGQTVASGQVTATATTVTNLEINLSWAPITGARGYNVYYATTSGSEANYFTTYTNSYNFNTPTGSTAGTPPTVSTAYNNTLSTTSNSQITLGNTTGSASSAQLDVAGNVPTAAIGAIAGGYTYISTQGNYTYATNPTSLVVIDVSNPANPVVVGTTTSGLSGAGELSVQGNYAYVINGSADSIQVFNISNPAAPVNIGSVSTGANPAISLNVQGNYLYSVSYGNNNLQVFNISNPAAPVSVGSTSVTTPWSITVQGIYAYVVTSGTNLLQVINVSNPAAPFVENFIGVDPGPYSVYIQGSYAYVASDAGTALQIVNISNPVNIYIVGTYSDSLNNYAIYVQGHYAYLTTSNSLQVIDVSNPATPTLVGSVSMQNYAYSISIQGRYAYIANTSLVQIFDLGGAYIQQLQAGGAEVGTLTVDTNAQVDGSEIISGALNVSSSLEVAGSTSLGNLTISSNVTTPTAPVVTPTGGTASTAYSYAIVAFNSSGQSAASTATHITNGTAFASLSSTVYNAISWSSVANATGYDVYRTVGGSTQGLIGVVYTGATLALSDTGLAASGATAPTAATTGTITDSTNSTSAVTVQNVSGSIALNVNTANSSVNLDQILAPGTITATLPPTISTPTIVGATGGATYTYEVVAAVANGATTYPSPTATVTTGNATLTASNYNIVNWGSVTGATNYYVYRTASTGTPSSTGLIGVIPSGTTTLNDTGTTKTTTTSGSETGTVLTLGYASTPAWVAQAGLQVTLVGYTMNTGSVNGTWTILSATATSMTVSIIGGVTSTISTQGTASPVTISLNSATGTAPSQPGALTNSTNYYFEVTAIDGTGGQTIPTSALSYTTATTGTNLAINLSWVPVTGARGYNVYYGIGSATYTNGYFTTYTNGYNFYTTAGSTAGSPPTASTAYNNTLSTTGNSQITLGNTTGSASTAQLDVAGNASAIGSVTTATDANGVYVQGSYAYVVDSTGNSFQVIDISTPTNPVVVGTITGLSDPISLYVQGNYAYVINNSSGTLQIVNVSTPTNPVSVGSVATGTSPNNVYVQGDYAYVVNGTSNTLQVINISNPAAPVVIGTSATTGLNSPESVYVQGRYAYVANGAVSGSLQVFDISNPASPTTVGSVTTGNKTFNVYVQGDYAYVVNYTSSTLQVINVTNPGSPVIVSTTNTSGSNPAAVNVEGHYAYVINNIGNSLQTFDISNPASPVSVGSVATLTGPQSFFVSSRYVYVADYSSTLQVFDLGGAYIQQLQVGGEETGTLSVDTNATVGGGESITSGLTVGGSTEISGSLSVAGPTIFEDMTDSTTAFQIDNNLNEPVFIVGTSSQGNNLLSYPGFESGSFTSASAGWVESGGTGTIAQNSILANTYNGLYSLKLTVTTATVGAQTSAFIQSVTSGTYVASFYIDPSTSVNATTFGVTTNSGSCTPASQVLVALVFTRLYCSFSLGATLTSFTITDATSSSTAYLDAVQLQSGSTPTAYEIGTVQIRGILANPLGIQTPSNSTTEFQVLNSSAVSLLTVNSSSGQIVIGNGATGDATGYVLTLDSKTGAIGDPTYIQGAMYYNVTSGTFRCGNGPGSTYQDCAVGFDYSNVSTTAVNGNTTGIQLLSSAATLPANYCTSGRDVQIIANGIYSTTTTAQPLSFNIELGTTTIGVSSTAFTPGISLTNAAWTLQFQIICNAAPGASVAVTGEGYATIFPAASTNTAALEVIPMETTTTTTTSAIATNGTLAVKLGVTFTGTASTLNTIQVNQFIAKGE